MTACNDMYVFKMERNLASYSYFVQQLENDFVGENLSILIEYGIPSNTVRQIANKIPSDLNEDDIVGLLEKTGKLYILGCYNMKLIGLSRCYN